jgi:hypothetical protein
LLAFLRCSNCEGANIPESNGRTKKESARLSRAESVHGLAITQQAPKMHLGVEAAMICERCGAKNGPLRIHCRVCETWSYEGGRRVGEIATWASIIFAVGFMGLVLAYGHS